MTRSKCCRCAGVASKKRPSTSELIRGAAPCTFCLREGPAPNQSHSTELLSMVPAERGHGRFPLTTAVAAGRQIEFGNSGRAGTVGRGSRRRACAVVCGLELCCSDWKRVIWRSADPVEPNCHGGNLRHNHRLRCHTLRENLAFRLNVCFRADFVCSTLESGHSEGYAGLPLLTSAFDPTRTFRIAGQSFFVFAEGGRSSPLNLGQPVMPRGVLSFSGRRAK